MLARIIFYAVILSLFGCDMGRQNRIERCLTFCSMTACRPNGGSVEPIQIEACGKCRTDCVNPNAE